MRVVRSFRRTAVLAFALAATALLPSQALAENLSGKTKQGRGVTLTTDAAGSATKLSVSWTAKCKNGSFRATTRITFKTPSIGSFISRGTFRSREGQYRFTTKAKSNGTQTKPPPGAAWKGAFSASVLVKEGKRKIDTCVSPKIKWSVAG